MPPHRAGIPIRKCSGISAMLLLAVVMAAQAGKQKHSGPEVVRWTKGNSGSSSSVTTDGKYLYGLKDKDLEISLAIDAQELEKVHHRPLPLFAVRIDAHYGGKAAIELKTDHISLEFVDHYQVVNTSLDPDELGARIQEDADNLSDEIEHQVRKHPEQKAAEESLLQQHLKDMTDLMGFVSLHSLQPGTLDSGNPDIGGWIFFSTKSKWIGRWKPQEEFVLRVPLKDSVFEFPFALPPHKGDLILRRRDE
jgi:hypothetical protein